MEFLRDLDIGKNKLIELPSWIGQVKSLTNFSVARTLSLTKLDSSIASLAHLERLNCSDCFNLIEPPYAVCEGGLSDVRQYYKDLGDDKTPMILSTVILVGKKHAGKSTLLSAMSNGFAAKSKSDKGVEKTKVFEITPVDLRGSGSHQSTVNVIDFGGDEVYQYAYRLTFCKDCIPIVVVDIEEYENLAIEFGMREATRRVAFDWLSHIITICPEVQEPILVSTHRDRYQDEKKYNDLCEQLKKTVKNLTGELLHGTDRSKTLTIFKDSDSESVTSCVFKKRDVFSTGFVSSDERYCKELKRLEERLYERVEQSKGVIPAIWQQIIALVDNEKEKSHLILKDLLNDQQRKSTVKAVLSFMKKSGRILYYPAAVRFSFLEDMDILNDKVFHNMPALTELISSLYDHNMKREIVVAATATDQAFTKHNSYLMNGVMSSQDLRNLISGDRRQIPFDISIALLKKFKLLHGPVTINSKGNWYLIPYFMPKHNFAVKAGEVSLQATLNFIGLKVPDYAFHQMTVAFLEHMAGRCYQVFPYGNGASTKIHTESDSGENELDITMSHDTDGQRIVVRAEGYATTVHTVWEKFCSLIQRLSKESKSAWPATQIAYEILCPHCLVLDKANPALINHKMITDDSSQGMQDVSSSSCSGETDIPYQLRRPCREQSASEIKSLRKYITDKGPNESELMKEIVKNQEPDIKLQAVHQNNLYSSSAMERVYRMTPTRGRALIINTGSQTDRKGSQHDYTNVEHMFEQFGFIISNLSADKNWKAKEVIEAIHEETQYVDSNGTSIHAHMGMFVLVLMSHGGYGTIGVDGCILKLVDIYRLLSPQNFPAMRGKPKMIILQSCSGETRMIKDDLPINQPGGVDEIQSTSSNKRGYEQEEEESCKRRKSEVQSNIGSDARVPGSNIRKDSHLCMDDLIVFHPSFPDYVAYRSLTNGSIFIRALVTTFYRQAGRKHAEQLSKTAKLQIRIYAKKLPTPDEPQCPPCHCSLVIQTLVREVAPELDVGQLPVTISTFTNERKLYLSPGVNMRTKDEHPRELLANPITPNPAKTEIIFKERVELINNKRVSLLKFDVKKLPTADQR